MDRLQTYIEGFDEVLGGGIPRGSVVLVCGTPGTMKTSVTFSILYNNVKNNGSKALYISLEEGHDDLKRAMTELGLAGIDDLELYILDVSKIRLEHKEDETSKNWFEILEKYIEQRVKMNKFDLVVIDSMAALYSLTQMQNPRRQLFHFFGFPTDVERRTGGHGGPQRDGRVLRGARREQGDKDRAATAMAQQESGAMREAPSAPWRRPSGAGVP